MKKLSLLLVALLCLSVVVNAGEVITNDTGEDATGLRVSFSTPVLITAFGDILTSVDPQMLSFEFVFSGGTVTPWESHWFNYAPATALMVEHEWLTDPSPTSPAMWWEDDQVWAISEGLAEKFVGLALSPSLQRSIDNHLDLYTSIGLDVVSWSLIAWAPNWKETYTEFTDALHELGVRVVGGMSMMKVGWEPPSLHIEDMSSALLIDPFGNEQRYGDFGFDSPLYSCLHPARQRFILQILKDHIDCGADGIYIDELAYGSTFDPDFNPYTLDLFNDYLMTQYSAGELKALAISEGFASFDEFDYASVVRSVLEDDFGTITQEEWGSLGGDTIPLLQDYRRFKRVENKRFAEWITSEIKDYALETQGKCIPVSANINTFSSPEAFMIVDLLDYVELEWPYFDFGYPPNARAFPTLRTAQAFGKRGVLLTDMLTRPDLIDRGAERTATLMKTLIAEAYAADGAFYVEESTDFLHFDMEALMPWWTFMESRPFLFEEVIRVPGSVAVLQLYESLDAYRSTDYKGLCHLLADSGFQFSTLVGSVDELVPHLLTLTDLEKFEAVIIPELRWLEDAHAALLLRYIENGGIVVVFADQDVMDWERPSVAQQVFDLLGRGTARIGEGSLVHVDFLIGSDYFLDPSDEERGTLLGLLASLDVFPEIRFSSPSLVSAFAYDGEDSRVIHFVNYDYNAALDETEISSGQAVRLSAPEIRNGDAISAIWYTPETDPIQLPVNVDGSSILLQMPTIEIWGTLLLTTQLTADHLSLLPLSKPPVGWIEEHTPKLREMESSSSMTEPDWADIEFTFRYEEAPLLPVLYSSNGVARSSVDLSNFGKLGSDVKGVKVACLEDGLFVRWETYSASIQGAYSYELHFRKYPEGLLAVSVDPVVLFASATLVQDGEHLPLEASMVSLEENAVTVWIPDPLVLCSSSPALPRWDIIPMLVHSRSSSVEQFELPLQGRIAESFLPPPTESDYSKESIDNNLIEITSKGITENLVARLREEATGKADLRVHVRLKAKGRPGNGIPSFRLRVNGKIVWEIVIDSYPSWAIYETDIVLPAAESVFSVGFSLPITGMNLSVNYIDVAGQRFELESLEDYGLFGDPPEVDPTFITFWGPGEFAWLVNLGE